ncbi:delta-1-pyrroline-5-carboxylate dehydrogenase-like protein [Dinothrombium tinctorium]|uniref:Multifunctional fusion protein n=1 Tax=Dinothrombium tinctorium TaxID=1965070 RepID=A0A3S3S3X4_9ACAR|nr:delta-1-pyrroline-5-carboxylate dehydrogenase-like protein [Dinothrombium tinctorium]
MLSRLKTPQSLLTSRFHFKRHLATSLNLTPKIDDFSVKNEPVLSYLNGSEERKQLENALKHYTNTCTEIPLIIDGNELKSDNVRYQFAPFDHSKKVAKYYWASNEQINDAINKSLMRRAQWERIPLSEKIKIFLKAGDLVSGKYRSHLNAATMLGQAKTVIQAEIDSAAELADFFRFNAFFAKELCKYQPISENKSEVLNMFRYRGIEGFIASISPFNFTAIGGNLASAPALMGNVVLWKPSDTALLSNYLIYKLLVEAGMPPGVINFVPSDGPTFGDTVTSSSHLAGINFTGSVATFKHLWKQTSAKLDTYRNYPRLVGECGGKNYHFVHPSADVETVVNATIRSAFEFGGQKCSACSRLYVPRSLWPKIKEGLVSVAQKIKVGSPLEYDTYFSAVIDEKAFKRITSYIEHAKNTSSLSLVFGGKYDSSLGYYIHPTIVETKDPKDRIIQEEIFGPVLTAFVYDDSKVYETIKLLDETSGYALTGAIFGSDEEFLTKATELLKMSAGNFYVNDKSTGSVVGQQPFGGGRLSGTNDKAGGPHYLLRWTSPQNVKQSFIPQKQWSYPYMSS